MRLEGAPHRLAASGPQAREMPKKASRPTESLHLILVHLGPGAP